MPVREHRTAARSDRALRPGLVFGAQRTRDIGARLALGAPGATIVRWVLEGALRFVALGLLIGLPIAWLLSRVIGGLIVGVRPFDPVTVTGATSALTIVALTAALAPARRAARLDPLLSLRSE